jgi:hypothetical protein
MNQFAYQLEKVIDRDGAVRSCLSCGTTENMARRKYCSSQCRQRLHYLLDIRTGLLRALNTRYATFYFSDNQLFLDLLLFGSEHIFSFVHPRTGHQKPGEDFSKMANQLGNVWWAERKRTHKHYLASRHLLSIAGRSEDDGNSVRPIETRRPIYIGKSLTRLKLSVEELESPGLNERIKSAFRRQALAHHPDKGGSPENFRRIHHAYIQLIGWAKNPRYARRRGIPNKWFYDGFRNQWIQPT